MKRIQILPTTAEHIRELGHMLRAEDAREILAFDIKPHTALWRGYRSSIRIRTALVDGVVAAIWGLGGAPLGLTGNPWLMTSAACEGISPLRFVRIYQEEVQRMLNIFPKLVNYVAADYTKSVRLLENVGFRLGDPVALGPHGVPFRKFEMEAVGHG